MQIPKILTPLSETTTGTKKYFINASYEQAINKAGGNIIGIGRPSLETIEAILDDADGLLLLGGHDVSPHYYNEKNINCNNICASRDELEIALFTKALEKHIPVLGICRGAQLMNVALGGSLYQDIAEDMDGSIQHDFHTDGNGVDMAHDYLAHEIKIPTDTILHTILGKTDFVVNSLHHQGINRLGTRFRVNAVAPDGLIEGIEIPEERFVIGLEWHPEELLKSKESQDLFFAFVNAARNS